MAKRDAARARHQAQQDPVVTDSQKGLRGEKRQSIKTNVEFDVAKRRLVINVFDGHLDHPQHINCSGWLVCPKIAVPFAHAAARILPLKKRYRTRDQFEKDLSDAFFKYCASHPESTKLELSALSTPFFKKFINDFLSEKKEDGSYKFAVSTRIHRLGALREIIEVLKRTDRSALPSDCDVPAANWPGESRDFKATEPLPFSTLKKFYSCCRAAVTATMRRMEGIWKAVDCVRAALKSGQAIEDTEENDFALAVIEISKKCNGYLPERQTLGRGSRVFELTELFGYKGLAAALYPQPKDLVPFIYLLAFFTIFNPQPLLDLNKKGIRFEDILGVRRVLLSSVKYRAAGTVQRRSFVVDESDDNPGRLIEFILRWTEPLRRFCDAKTRSKLFIYSGRNKGTETKVETYALAVSGRAVNFSNHAELFCEENGFDWIGLRRIRVTGAEIADLALEGDPIAIRTLLGHKRADADQHYRTLQTKRRGEARLATGMHLRHRWLDSDGKIDPRGPHRDESLSAATPGWHCVAPYESPILGEIPGRLCGALGRCPGCPLAFLDLTSPYSLCRCLQLKQRFIEVRAELGPKAWKSKWGLEYSKLTEFWLPQFRDDRVVAEARQLTLSPFPPLD